MTNPNLSNNILVNSVETDIEIPYAFEGRFNSLISASRQHNNRLHSEE